jgi:predicted HicB family RNase H-like nuclease
MKRRSEPSPKLQVNLPASLKREVELRADAAGQTLSSWVQRLIASHIKTTEAAKQ